MTEIADYINQTGPAVVAARLRALPAWAIFNAMVKSPADLIPIADAMGWQTLADANAWVQASLALPKSDIFLKQALAQSTQMYEPYYVSEWVAMDTAIAGQCNRASDFWRSNSDDIYRVPKLAQVEQMAKECYSHRFAYGGQDMDCDDAVNIARGWLSSNQLGNLSVGKCTMRLWNDAEFIGGHSLLLVITKETTASPLICHWWEPQNGAVYPVSFTQLAGKMDCTRIELFFCDY